MTRGKENALFLLVTLLSIGTILYGAFAVNSKISIALVPVAVMLNTIAKKVDKTREQEQKVGVMEVSSVR
jgi:hypothetical protein